MEQSCDLPRIHFIIISVRLEGIVKDLYKFCIKFIILCL